MSASRIITGADVAAEAKSWEGTPCRWQGSVKGAGCDCKGLVVGVARTLGLPEAESLYAAMADYRVGMVDVRLLKQGLSETLARVEDMQAGDVLLLFLAGVPQHLAILTDPPQPGRGGKMVHSWGLAGRRVVEVPFTQGRRLRELDSVWRFPSVIQGERP